MTLRPSTASQLACANNTLEKSDGSVHRARKSREGDSKLRLAKIEVQGDGPDRKI